MKVFFRHDHARLVQQEIIKDAYTAFATSRHLIAHAPTGCGKTDALLSPAISYAIENDMNVFFMTPKISQHKIAVETIKDLKEKHNIKTLGVDLIGKKHMCVNHSLLEKDSSDFYELCQKKIKNHECPHYILAKGHNPRQRSEAKMRVDHILSQYEGIETSGDLKKLCVEFGKEFKIKTPCPYEVSIQIAEKANFIICDYYHILNPYISSTFLEKIGKNLEDSILILDEAHNAPARLRKAMSVAIDEFSVQKAYEEAKRMKNDVLAERIALLGEDLRRLDKQRVEDETIAYKEELSIMKDYILDMEETGLKYLEQTDRHRSHLLRVARFFYTWEQDNISFFRIMKKTEKGLRVEFKCLDPSVVTAGPLNEAHSSVLMSATLKPGEMYRDIMGLDYDRTFLKEYGSPFPKRHRLSLLDDTVSTRYERRDNEGYEKIASNISKITNNIPGNSAVFFPSYKVLKEIFSRAKKDIKKKIFVQEAKSSPENIIKMMKEFQKNKKTGGVLFAVSGGSLSEGIDLPGDNLLCVIVVGVPLNEPDIETKALIQYYEFKYGKGWDYGYIFPAMSKAVQAAGRCIRSDDDRGVIVFMDERFGWNKYSKLIPNEYSLMPAKDLEKEVKEFWKT